MPWTPRPLEPLLQFFKDGGGQEWKHDLVVADQGNPFTAFQGRPLHHVEGRAVMLDEIHVDRGEVDQGMAQVSDEGHGL